MHGAIEANVCINVYDSNRILVFSEDCQAPIVVRPRVAQREDPWRLRAGEIEAPMEYGILGSALDPRLCVRNAQAAENNGFTTFALGDSHTQFGDPYVQLGAAATATQSIRLATMVTNPVTRHVAATANAISTVDALSGGRAVLGIGTGDNAVLNIGKSRASLRQLEAAILAIRSLVGGQYATVDGANIISRWASHPVPILMTAEGPKALRLAGKIADGVVIGTGVTPDAVATALSWVSEGAESVGRSIEDIEVWFMAWWLTGQSKSDAILNNRSRLASVGHHALRGDRDAKGVPRELVPGLDQLERSYDSTQHGAPGDSPNARLVERLGLVDYLADRFAIAGTSEDCAARVRDLGELGVGRLMLTYDRYLNSVQQIDLWGSEVIPLINV
jgi:5,10-methylenetetrahydromethanopterin reductase